MAIAGGAGAAAGTGAGVAAAAAVAEAIKASGALIRIEPDDFERMIGRIEQPLVVHSVTGMRKTKHEYMTSYRGFIFHAKSNTELHLPAGCETIQAKKIWIPG